MNGVSVFKSQKFGHPSVFLNGVFNRRKLKGANMFPLAETGHQKLVSVRKDKII
jgi:hypothetical protein